MIRAAPRTYAAKNSAIVWSAVQANWVCVKSSKRSGIIKLYISEKKIEGPKTLRNYSRLTQPIVGAVRATGVDSEAARSRGKL